MARPLRPSDRPDLLLGANTPGVWGPRPQAALRGPAQEIPDHAQADMLALFRVELHTQHGVPANDRGDVTAIVHMGNALFGFGHVYL